MASDIDICNLALSHLGDTATVTSLNPPEGSMQAQHCATFYTIARDSLLEMHSWGFATKRVSLAQLSNPSTEWDYCYMLPTDVLNVLGILPPNSTDDYSAPIAVSPQYGYLSMTTPVVGAGSYVTQPYSVETLADGTQVVFSDQQGAMMRYTAKVTDTTKFTPLFVNTLSWMLASMLAGPVIKGDVGAAEGKRCLQLAYQFLGAAESSDTNQRNIKPQQVVNWMAGR